MRTFFMLLFIVVGASTASAETYRITRDIGGRIGLYVQYFLMIRAHGDFIVVDGPCLSACTLITGIIAHEHTCATKRAKFGFHAAWTPDEYGRPVMSEPGTAVLMSVYPPEIKKWIEHRGGLTGRMIYLRGAELSRLYPRCGKNRAIGQPLALHSPLPRRAPRAARR
jgi:hypothetical protein